MTPPASSPSERKLRTEKDAVSFRRTVTIRRPSQELYTFWHDFENLPRFMRHLKSVTVTGPTTSRWIAQAPAGQEVAWDARIIEDVSGEWIAWTSVPGSQIENAGSVAFHPAPFDRGTEVTVELSYVPPGGALGKLVATLFGEEPEQQVSDDLIRFQALMETGEVPTTEGQTSGRRKNETKETEETR
jgi:uncharacterized membrane protein